MLGKSLLTDKFEQNTIKFDKHYSSVVKIALNKSSEVGRPFHIMD